MKKILFLALGLLLSGLQSCSDKNEDTIWDYAPYILSMDVVDSEGRNLLDPDVEGNIIGERIEMFYDDECYPVRLAEIPEMQSRYYLPRFFGLVRSKKWDYEVHEYTVWQLFWGEFDCAYSRSYSFSLQFPERNGLTYEFDLKISNKGGDNVTRELKVNGKKMEEPSGFTIVLK